MRFRLLDNAVTVFGEMIATAMLMFLGCMGCVTSLTFINTNLQCSLNFGFVVLICIQCFGCVCGAHLNPCVTIAQLIYQMISWPMAIAYFVAQILGAFIGYGLLKACLPEDAICSSSTPKGVCLTMLADSLTPGQGVLIEFLLTFVLIFICCAVWDPRNAKFQDSTAVRFGLAIACLSLTGVGFFIPDLFFISNICHSQGQFTGASMNPARSLAPALWNNYWEYHWIYWVGPLSASVLSSLVYRFIFRREVVDKNTLPE